MNITEHTRVKIIKEQFDKLDADISVVHREIFKKKIDSLNHISEDDKENDIKLTGTIFSLRSQHI